MDKSNLKICRLCMRMIDDEKFEMLETLRSDMLNAIMGTNIFTCLDQIICCKCADILQKCFDFKMICLNTEDNIKKFSNVNGLMKIDLKDVCVMELFKDSKTHENQKICRLCLNWGSSSYRNLANKVDGIPLNEMMLNCLPELNLDLTNELLICSSCVDLLKEEFTFILDFMEVQKKIKPYQDLQSNVSLSSLGLYSDLKFSQKLKLENDIEIGYVKLENTTFSLNEGIRLKVEPKDEISDDCLIVSSNVELKDENICDIEDFRQEQNMSIPGRNKTEDSDILEQEKCSYTISCTSTLKKHVNMKQNVQEFRGNHCSYETGLNSHPTQYISDNKNCRQPLMHKCTECPYESNVRSNLMRHIQYKHQEPIEFQLYKCENCSYETKRKGYLKKHMIVHKDPSELQMYKCTYCSFETKRKYSLDHHIQYKHKMDNSLQIYCCGYCSYETKYKYGLKKHLMVHKKPSQIHMHKCINCSFQTKQRETLVQHIVNEHKDPNKLQMYKCNNCSYETKQKDSLVTHIICKRTAPFVVQLYKCENCCYETKRKDYLKKHMIVHKDPSQLQMYKCTYCCHETKQKIYLERHMALHKDPIEQQIYKCVTCTFETRRKHYLRQHNLLVHKDRSELQMYKCTYCSYESKDKYYLSNHMIVHKPLGEVQVYKCLSCSYETNRKNSLVKHIQCKHTDRSKLQLYKCANCSYGTLHKHRLKGHMILHKYPIYCSYESKDKYYLDNHMSVYKTCGEVRMYKCMSCSYVAKQKNSLVKHIQCKHTDRSKLQLYKCANCSFDTLYKNRLRGHMILHMYKCTYCAYDARDKYGLQKHLITHKNPIKM